MKVIRWLLGRLILLINALTLPRGVKRSAEQQALIDQQTAALALYQYKACPFCVKVRRSMKRHSLAIETREVKNHPVHRAELEQGGGQVKVPCLRIDEGNGQVRWLYESSEIVSYLEQRFVGAEFSQDATA
ncbi:glutaredoxin family protein [Motiliproteus sediminis]|uniref:glutaredoxin family protein n=1 Tax=Motiliproteus sediminis TaxID=1468178 RepID=UPI001AEFBA65|nr:glutaredoxin [Motiliproteus sediminis]